MFYMKVVYDNVVWIDIFYITSMETRAKHGLEFRQI